MTVGQSSLRAQQRPARSSGGAIPPEPEYPLLIQPDTVPLGDSRCGQPAPRFGGCHDRIQVDCPEVNIGPTRVAEPAAGSHHRESWRHPIRLASINSDGSASDSSRRPIPETVESPTFPRAIIGLTWNRLWPAAAPNSSARLTLSCRFTSRPEWLPSGATAEPRARSGPSRPRAAVAAYRVPRHPAHRGCRGSGGGICRRAHRVRASRFRHGRRGDGRRRA